MKRQGFLITLMVLLLLCSGVVLTYAQELSEIKLPAPRLDRGKPLMQALNERQSQREFSNKELPIEVLSDLLWAADGINRPDSGKRTAPSAVNWQNIDIYVAMAKGIYLYNYKAHSLKPVMAKDIRAASGIQNFVKEVPVNLIYVADYSKIARGDDQQKLFYSAAHTGFISQNVYLYCASEGLATVVRGAIDKEALAKTMKLRPDQKVMLAQSVGYPKK